MKKSRTTFKKPAETNFTQIEMFSLERIALTKEVKKHPKLVEKLAQQGSEEWGDMVGTIAAYCNMGMDGMYLPSQLDKIAGDLVWKLRKHSEIIIT